MRQIRAKNFYEELYDFLISKNYQLFIKNNIQNSNFEYIALHSIHKNLNDSESLIFHINDYKICSKDEFKDMLDLKYLNIIKNDNDIYLEDYNEFYLKYYKKYPEHRLDLLNNYYVEHNFYLEMPIFFTEKQEAIDYIKDLIFENDKNRFENYRIQEHLFHTLNIFNNNHILDIKESNNLVKKIIIKNKEFIQQPEYFPVFRDSLIKFFNYDNKEIKFLSKYIKRFDMLLNRKDIEYLTIENKDKFNSLATLDINSLIINKNIDFLEQIYYSDFSFSLIKKFLHIKNYNENINKSSVSQQINRTEFKENYIGYSNTQVLSFEIPTHELQLLKKIINEWFSYLNKLNLNYDDINDLRHASNHEKFVNSLIIQHDLNKQYGTNENQTKKNKI